MHLWLASAHWDLTEPLVILPQNFPAHSVTNVWHMKPQTETIYEWIFYNL